MTAAPLVWMVLGALAWAHVARVGRYQRARLVRRLRGGRTKGR